MINSLNSVLKLFLRFLIVSPISEIRIPVGHVRLFIDIPKLVLIYLVNVFFITISVISCLSLMLIILMFIAILIVLLHNKNVR